MKPGMSAATDVTPAKVSDDSTPNAAYFPNAAPEADVFGRTLAFVALLAAGSGIQLTHNLSLAIVAACAVAPLAFPALARFTVIRWLLPLAALALASGWALRLSADLPANIVGNQASDLALRFVTGLAVLLIVMWARTLVPLWQVGMLYGIGALGHAVVSAGAFSASGFKFHLATPLAVVVLSVCDSRRKRLVAVAAIVVVGLIGITDDARSFFGFCLVTALLLAFQAARSGRGRMSRWTPAALLAGLSVAVYLVVSQLMQVGVFGAELQLKAQQQIAAGGSLLAGGRPEWGATLALMRVHPWGYGLDVLPSYSDVLDAKRGLASAGLQVADNGYVDNYMFGTVLNLHSVIADLWGQLGIAGLVLALAVVVVLVANLSRGLADGSAGGLVLFAPIVALWDLAFGPFYTSWPDVCFALAVTIAFRRAWKSQPQPDAVSAALPTGG